MSEHEGGSLYMYFYMLNVGIPNDKVSQINLPADNAFMHSLTTHF